MGSDNHSKAEPIARVFVRVRSPNGRLLVHAREVGRTFTVCGREEAWDPAGDAEVTCSRCRRTMGAPTARQELAADFASIRSQGDFWRRANVAWQEWAAALLAEIGAQPAGGVLGDEAARETIARKMRERAAEVARG